MRARVRAQAGERAPLRFAHRPKGTAGRCCQQENGGAQRRRGRRSGPRQAEAQTEEGGCRGKARLAWQAAAVSWGWLSSRQLGQLQAATPGRGAAGCRVPPRPGAPSPRLSISVRTRWGLQCVATHTCPWQRCCAVCNQQGWGKGMHASFNSTTVSAFFLGAARSKQVLGCGCNSSHYAFKCARPL